MAGVGRLRRRAIRRPLHPAGKEPVMTRPFEGIRIIDITHVLAGPFAAYQLAVLGADVIKVEHPDEPDHSREGGTDRALNRRNMGTSFLTQGSNKRSNYPGSEAGSRPRDPQEAGRRRRCVGRELPAGGIRGPRARLRGVAEDQPAPDLLLDLGLWPGRRAARADRL